MPAAADIQSAACVRDVMTARVHTLELDDSVYQAARLFERERFHHVVILARGKVFGVISDRDILKSISPFVGNPVLERAQDLATLRKRVHQIMTRKPVTVNPAVSIGEAARTMLAQKVSCLPVVDDHGALLGILTVRDLVAQLSPAGQEE